MTLNDTRITKLRKIWQDNRERHAERDVGGRGCDLFRKWYGQSEDPESKQSCFDSYSKLEFPDREFHALPLR
jgi:hypothetical protein